MITKSLNRRRLARPVTAILLALTAMPYVSASDSDAYSKDSKCSAAIERAVESSIEIDGSTYTITSQANHTCSLKKLAAQPTTAIRIPEKVVINGEEYTVETVGEDFLSENTDVETLIIPGTIKTLPNDCAFFANLTKLKNLTLEDSKTKLNLGKSEYYKDCPFETVYLGRSITYTSREGIDPALGELVRYLSPFAPKETLTEVKIGPYISKIENQLFNGSKNLSIIEGGENVTTIGDEAFNDCESLTSISFNRVINIGKEAFTGNSALKSASFGDALQTIGDHAFAVCNNLENIKLGNSLTKIGENAFSMCNSLRQIDLPESLTEIGRLAFDCCISLSGLLTIPANVKTIPEYAFSRTGYTVCELKSAEFVKLDESEERIGNVETIIVPSDLASTYRESNWGEMYDIISNSGISVSVEVTTPGNLAKDIVNQTRKAPASVNKLIITGGQLNQDDFNVMKSNMTACFDIDMSAADCADIYEGAFNGKQILRSIILPNNATSIGANAFSDCTILDTVFATDNMINVGYGAFQNCAALKKVNLGDNVSEIGSSAFYNAYNLNDFNMPSAVTSIGDYAFYNASKLESIALSENVKSIGSYAFANCSSLNEFSMPNTIESLGDGVFSNTAIENIDLSDFDELTAISNSLFSGCQQLQSIVFPKNIATIGNCAFMGCTSLTEANLEETNISKIGESAFSGCSKLSSVSLPGSTTDIADHAFELCRKLRTINISAITPPSVYKNTFKNVANDVCTISIPTNSFYDYLLAQYWGSFVDLKASIDIVSEDEDIDVSYDVYDSEEEANEGLAEEDNTAARRAPQAKAADSNSLAGGMSLFVNTAKVVRFHINETNGSEVSQILLNGEDITDQVVNGYFILANFGDINTLEIKAKPNSGISDITVNDKINANTIVDVYNLSGAQVMKGVEMGSVSNLNLNAGIYIVRSANAVKKVVIR